MITDLLNFLGGGIVKSVDGVVKTVFGSKEQRDADAHTEQMTVMETFAAEFLPRENRTLWDSFVDGVNRLVRPTMTFGTIYIFYFCLSDPAAFALAMESLKLMPGEGWALLGTIVVFWFGGKFLEKSWGQGMKIPSPELIDRIIQLRKQLNEEKREEQLRKEALENVKE